MSKRPRQFAPLQRQKLPAVATAPSWGSALDGSNSEMEGIPERMPVTQLVAATGGGAIPPNGGGSNSARTSEGPIQRQEDGCRVPNPNAANITGINSIPDYTGDLPSPLQVMNYIPHDFGSAFYVPDDEIRGWVQDASSHQNLPPELLPLIMQQENNPNASFGRQVLQHGERQLTTAMTNVDEMTGGGFGNMLSGLNDLTEEYVGGPLAKLTGFMERGVGSSTGFVNMSRGALQSGDAYSEDVLGRDTIPPEVAERMGGLVNADTGVSGNDWRSDLYYTAAHLRELVDSEMGEEGFQGDLTVDNIRDIAASYNGTGPMAEKYGNDAANLLQNAANGEDTLYFLQQNLCEAPEGEQDGLDPIEETGDHSAGPEEVTEGEDGLNPIDSAAGAGEEVVNTNEERGGESEGLAPLEETSETEAPAPEPPP